MKKKLLNIVLALTVVIAGAAVASTTAHAEEVNVNWAVTYNGDKSAWDSTYDTSNAKDVISSAMPGDNLSYTVEYKNNTDKPATFYVNTGVVETLEEASGGKSAGGAYSYKIENIVDGKSEMLFDSETVGGDIAEGSKKAVGLDQVDKGQETYFVLGSVAPGKTQQVKVTVSLDGNTINNNYMNQLKEEGLGTAGLNIRFGAEPTSEANDGDHKVITNKNTIVRRIVKTLDNGAQVVVIDDDDVPLAAPRTGDSIMPIVMCTLALVLGLLMIAWYFMMTRNDRREEA